MGETEILSEKCRVNRTEQFITTREGYPDTPAFKRRASDKIRN